MPFRSDYSMIPFLDIFASQDAAHRVIVDVKFDGVSLLGEQGGFTFTESATEVEVTAAVVNILGLAQDTLLDMILPYLAEYRREHAVPYVAQAHTVEIHATFDGESIEKGSLEWMFFDRANESSVTAMLVMLLEQVQDVLLEKVSSHSERFMSW